jgi:hypothetical protein
MEQNRCEQNVHGLEKVHLTPKLQQVARRVIVNASTLEANTKNPKSAVTPWVASLKLQKQIYKTKTVINRA